MKLPFEQDEYDRRLGATRARMSEQGIDLLIASDPSNMNYLTGYDGWSFYVPQAVVVHQEEAAPFWIGRLMDANAARVKTTLPDAHVLGYPDRYVQSTERHPLDYVADFIRDRGWGRARIAVEMDAYYYTAASHAALVAGLPEATITDSGSLVAWVRSVKSEPEIERMREAARIAENVMRTAYEAVAPGVRQCDAVARIYAAQMEGTPEFGGEYTGLCPMLPTGIGTSTPHLTWTDEPFVRGEATILELGGARHRYHCPMARTLHLGPPPPRLADTAQIVLEGMDAALAQARTGETAESVEAAWRAVISRHGLEKESRIGYSIGIGYPPDWGEHTISLRPGDTHVLRTNNTLHMILGMWMDDWGLEVSEAFRVTEAGAECLASFPRDLFVKD